jgi:hypothetical protein
MKTAILCIAIATAALVACATSADPQYGAGGYDPSNGNTGGGNNGGNAAGVDGTGGGTDGTGDGTGNGTGTGTGNGTGGGTSGGSTKDSGSGTTTTASFGACVQPASPNGSGHHNDGKDCLECHNANNTKGAPHWYLGGTLYDSATGTTPLAGATIEIIDASGAAQELVTAANGNFWTDQQVKFPIKIRASSCPDSNEMMQSDTSGACGKAGCHDSTNRIHLP